MGTTESSLSYEDDQLSPELQPSSSQEHPSSPRPRQSPSNASHSQRRRSAITKPPIKRINGLVVGGPSTGKRTLLQRLEGHDPYAKTKHVQEVVSSKIIIPYKPPPEKPCWDRIQLHVEAARNSKENEDFVVFMISPRHDLASTRAYIINILTTILLHSGYFKSAEDFKDEEGDIKTSGEPVCMCVLFNFRDLPESVPQEEIKKIFEEILQPVPREKLVLQFASTCLRNCYGLSVLHDFIYRTYLQRRRRDLELQMREVGAQIDAMDETPIMSYDDFLKLLGPSNQPKAQINHSEVEPPNASNHWPMRTSHQQRPTNNSPQERQRHPPGTPRSQVTVNGIPKKGDPRRLFNTQQKPVLVGRAALEAFLASDSEEDERSALAKKKISSIESSDDDDDDDFFYDESGKRRFNHPTLRNRDIGISSSDESDEPPLRGARMQPATATKQKIASRKQPVTVPPKPALQKSEEGKTSVKIVDLLKDMQLHDKLTEPPEHDDKTAEPEIVSSSSTRTIEKTEAIKSEQAGQTGTDVMDSASMDESETIAVVKQEIEESHVAESYERYLERTGSAEEGSDEGGKETPVGDLHTHSAKAPLDVTAVNNKIEVEGGTDDLQVPTEAHATEETPYSGKEDNNEEDEDIFIDSIGEQYLDQIEGSEESGTRGSDAAKAPPSNPDDSDDDEFMIDNTSPTIVDEKAAVEVAIEENSPTGEKAQAPQSNPDDNSDDDEFTIENASPRAMDDDDDDDEVIESGPPGESTKTEQVDSDEKDFVVDEESSSRPQPPTEDVDDIDDDEFFIGSEVAVSQERPRPADKASEPPPQKPQAPQVETPSSGISAAALAAIAAAQKEAEAMLLQPNPPPSESYKPKKAKKETKEKKEKKKKKKEKKSRDD